jgi:hypothetical protein
MSEPVRVDVARHCPTCFGDVYVETELMRPVAMHCGHHPCMGDRGGRSCDWYVALDVPKADHYIVVACLRIC